MTKVLTEQEAKTIKTAMDFPKKPKLKLSFIISLISILVICFVFGFMVGRALAWGGFGESYGNSPQAWQQHLNDESQSLENERQANEIRELKQEQWEHEQQDYLRQEERRRNDSPYQPYQPPPIYKLYP